MSTATTTLQNTPPRKTIVVDTIRPPQRTNVWGVGFDILTYEECMAAIDAQIQSGEPGYAITANLQYVMLTDQYPDLIDVNRNAKLVVADGMPIVWRSKLNAACLPERIAGSDLIYSIAELAGKRKYRVYFLGGAPGVAQQTADRLSAQYPGLKVAGVESPPFRPLTKEEDQAMATRIRDARPDILFAALGQPQGEQWIARWYQFADVPLCLQIGGSFNFVIGQVSRCPRWMANTGLEWLWRLACEPRRLLGRYTSNMLFLLKAVLRDIGNR